MARSIELDEMAEAARKAVAAHLFAGGVSNRRVYVRPDKLGPIIVISCMAGDTDAALAWREGYGRSHGPFRIAVNPWKKRAPVPDRRQEAPR